MSALPLPLLPVLTLFGQRITVYDITVSRVDGREQKIQSADRIIFGIIQPLDDKKLKIERDGELSDGNLILRTKDVVSMTDLTQPTDLFIQTYVRYEGEIWKLNAIKSWQDKTGGINKYLLTKYVNIDDSNV